MKQQLYQNIGTLIVNHAAMCTPSDPVMRNYIAKLRILLEGGDKAASVVRELANMSTPELVPLTSDPQTHSSPPPSASEGTMSRFAPRDPEHLSPYGDNDHSIGRFTSDESQ